MDDAWEVLKQAGLPDGAARRRPQGLPPDHRVQAALGVVEMQLDTLETRYQELLHAWLQAGFHHWPSQFGQVVGQAGAECRDRLMRAAKQEMDLGRFLKLRRIAIENLSVSL